MKKVLLISAFILCFSTSLFAQCSSWIEASPANGVEGAYSVTTDANDNVYSAGSFSGSINFGNDTLTDTISFASVLDTLFGFYINKFNSSGVVQWAIQLPTPDYFFFQPPVIYQQNRALYVAGMYYDTLITNVKNNTMLAMPGYNYFILKLDLNGNIIWAKNYHESIVGGFSANVNAIAANNLSQIYITGDFSDTATFGSNVLTSPGAEAFITKIDTNGNVLRAIQSTSVAQSSYNLGNSITTDENGNILLAGECDSIITFGTQTFNAYDTVFSTSQGTRTNPFLAKFDSSGNCQWITGGQGNVNGWNSFGNVVADSQNNVYFIGTIYSTFTFNGQILNPSHGETFYCKYSPAGSPIWIKQTGQSSGSYNPVYNSGTSSLVIDASNHLWMGGYLGKSAIFGNFSLPAQSLFMAEFDTGGTFLNAIGSNGIGVNSLALGNEGDLYAGCSGDTATIVFDGNTLICPTGENNVILKYCTSASGIPQLSTNNNQLSIYPNPTNGIINITSTKNIDAITVINLLGQTMLKSPLGDLGVTRQEIDLSKFPDGMYFATVTSGTEITTGKIIVSK